MAKDETSGSSRISIIVLGVVPKIDSLARRKKKEKDSKKEIENSLHNAYKTMR